MATISTAHTRQHWPLLPCAPGRYLGCRCLQQQRAVCKAARELDQADREVQSRQQPAGLGLRSAAARHSTAQHRSMRDVQAGVLAEDGRRAAG